MASDGVQIDFCTLGMFIIDEIHFKPPIEPRFNVLGGAGSYAALGARLFSPGTQSKSVGWIVDAGSDFPAQVKHVIDDWKTSCLIRDTPDRLTTRGWNGYGENEERAFRYTTPKLRLDADSLNTQLLCSRSFHLICSPARCIDLVKNIKARRASVTPPPAQPAIFIWEPVPDLCTQEEMPHCLEALQHVDVVSPNHSELCGFFAANPYSPNGDANAKSIEDCCDKWLESGIGPDGRGAVVIRAGKDGCFVATRQRSNWCPAYHARQQSKVVDPTGGGNGFLGGFAVGLVRSASDKNGLSAVQEAALWGSVAASFAIEQVGMPVLQYAENDETWNGDSVEGRLNILRDLIKPTLEQFTTIPPDAQLHLRRGGQQ